MNFPSLPTDSLLKFLALGGLFSALGTYFYQEKTELSIEEQIIRTKGAVELLNLEVDFLNSLLQEKHDAISRKYQGTLSNSDLPRWNQFRLAVSTGAYSSWSDKRIKHTSDSLARLDVNVLGKVVADTFEARIRNQEDAIIRALEGTDKSALKAISDLSLEVKRKEVLIHGEQQLIELYDRRSTIYRTLAWLIIVLSGLLSAYGFRGWHEMESKSRRLPTEYRRNRT